MSNNPEERTYENISCFNLQSRTRVRRERRGTEKERGEICTAEKNGRHCASLAAGRQASDGRQAAPGSKSGETKQGRDDKQTGPGSKSD
jgi:hypothetical protein